jgi:hypothetical protein
MSAPTLDPEYQPNPIHFAVIVEGEVAWLHSIDTRLERAVAAFRSDPMIVEITESQKKVVKLDWKYDGSTFTSSE